MTLTECKAARNQRNIERLTNRLADLEAQREFIETRNNEDQMLKLEQEISQVLRFLEVMVA